MLVLGLRVGEKVQIGDSIWIRYMGPGKFQDQISIAFQAPDDVPILRENAGVRHRKDTNGERNK